jgi:hypothetical protein
MTPRSLSLRVSEAPLENVSYMSAKVSEINHNVSDEVDLTGYSKLDQIVSCKNFDTGEHEHE